MKQRLNTPGNLMISHHGAVVGRAKGFQQYQSDVIEFAEPNAFSKVERVGLSARNTVTFPPAKPEIESENVSYLVLLNDTFQRILKTAFPSNVDDATTDSRLESFLL